MLRIDNDANKLLIAVYVEKTRTACTINKLFGRRKIMWRLQNFDVWKV